MVCRHVCVTTFLSERVYRLTEGLNFFRDGRFCGIGPLGGQRFRGLLSLAVVAVKFFFLGYRVSWNCGSSQLYTAAPHACSCKASDEATTTASHSACVCLKTSSELYSGLRHRRARRRHRQLADRPNAAAKLGTAPRRSGCPRDQPRSPAPRPRGAGSGLRPNHGVITAKIRGPPRLPPWGTTRHVLASIRSTRAPAPAGTSLLAPGRCTRPPQRGQRHNGRAGGAEEADRSSRSGALRRRLPPVDRSRFFGVI